MKLRTCLLAVLGSSFGEHMDEGLGHTALRCLGCRVERSESIGP